MRVVVIGAGYAGTIAANRAARKIPGASVTVINPRSDFVERVRLHQVVARTGDAATPLTSMLRQDISVVVGSARRVGDGAVDLADGRRIAYDYAIIAVGSDVASLPGALGVGTWEQARQARKALGELPSASRVTVVGGGLTGIETATEIAEARPDLRVRLLGDTIGASLHPRVQSAVSRTCERLGVEISTGHVERAPTDADLTLLAVVGAIPSLCADSGLAVDRDGRAVVDETLRSIGDERVFVVGDCAAGSRMSCQAANPQGMHAATMVARIANGQRLAPFSMSFVGQAVSLGRTDGAIQLSHLDDAVLPIHLGGRAAAITKEAVCRGAKWAARSALFTSPKRPRRALMRSALFDAK